MGFDQKQSVPKYFTQFVLLEVYCSIFKAKILLYTKLEKVVFFVHRKFFPACRALHDNLRTVLKVCIHAYFMSQHLKNEQMLPYDIVTHFYIAPLQHFFHVHSQHSLAVHLSK